MPNDTLNKVRFTLPRVNNASCPPGKLEAFLWDTDTPGLGIRSQSKARSFIFRGRFNNRSLRITIGSIDAWTIDDARNEVRRLRGLIAQGIDPRMDRQRRIDTEERERKDQRRATYTLGEVWTRYLEERSPRWSDHHRHDHKSAMQAPGQPKSRGKGTTVAGPLWTLRNVRLTDLNSELLKDWIETESKKRPTVAARSYRLLRALLNWLAEHSDYTGLLDASLLLTRRVRESVPTVRARKDDVLQRDQLYSWFNAVQQESDPVISAYLQTLLLTGARREELLSLTWKNVGFQWSALTIKDKVESERIIPLTPHVANLLMTLPRRNEWVFSSTRSSSGRLRAVTRPHGRVLEIAGLPNVSIHGLRRSFASLAEWAEAPSGVIAQIMGHKPSAIAEKHYRNRPLDLLRKWHVQIECWILDQAKIEQPKTTSDKHLRVVK